MRFPKAIFYPCFLFSMLFFIGPVFLPAYAEEAHDHGDDHENQEEEHGRSKEHDDHTDDHDDETVKVADEQLKEFGVSLGEAGPGIVHEYIEVPGEIVANQDSLSHIAPRFPGIVTEVHKQIGDKVKAGEALAVIESNESLRPYSLKSLIEGTLIQKRITRGDFLKEDDLAFIVADLSTVWVNLSIYQTDLPNVKRGQRVIISQGHNQPEIEGELSYLSPVVNEPTRTAVARAVIPNKDLIWRPGLFVTARILVGEKQVEFLIPQTSLQMINGATVVFVRTEDGFRPTPVSLGAENETHVEITSGLRAGDTYVTKNGFTLKAELEKGSFGDGHDH